MPERDSERHEAAAATPALAVGAGRPRARASATAVRTVLATELLGPAGLLRIELDGEIYTLRLTRNHRLILTK